MAKDPAVLFYTNDFLSRTLTMSNEQVGKYIRLLCIQHQQGHLTEQDMLYICKTYDLAVYSKFIKEGDNYYNERMRLETEKRKKYSESRRSNRNSVKEENISKSYVKHMEDGNEDININNNEEKKMDKIKEVQKEYFIDLLPIDSTQQFIEAWNEWVDFRKEIKKKLTKLSAKRQITFLINQPNPIKCINQSIQNGWTGLFEFTDKTKPKVIEHSGRVVTTKEDNDWKRVLAENERKLKEQGAWDGKIKI